MRFQKQILGCFVGSLFLPFLKAEERDIPEETNLENPFLEENSPTTPSESPSFERDPQLQRFFQALEDPILSLNAGDRSWIPQGEARVEAWFSSLSKEEKAFLTAHHWKQAAQIFLSSSQDPHNHAFSALEGVSYLPLKIIALEGDYVLQSFDSQFVEVLSEQGAESSIKGARINKLDDQTLDDWEKVFLPLIHPLSKDYQKQAVANYLTYRPSFPAWIPQSRFAVLDVITKEGKEVSLKVFWESRFEISHFDPSAFHFESNHFLFGAQQPVSQIPFAPVFFKGAKVELLSSYETFAQGKVPLMEFSQQNSYLLYDVSFLDQEGKRTRFLWLQILDFQQPFPSLPSDLLGRYDALILDVSSSCGGNVLFVQQALAKVLGGKTPQNVWHILRPDYASKQFYNLVAPSFFAWRSGEFRESFDWPLIGAALDAASEKSASIGPLPLSPVNPEDVPQEGFLDHLPIIALGGSQTFSASRYFLSILHDYAKKKRGHNLGVFQVSQLNSQPISTERRVRMTQEFGGFDYSIASSLLWPHYHAPSEELSLGMKLFDENLEELYPNFQEVPFIGQQTVSEYEGGFPSFWPDLTKEFRSLNLKKMEKE